MNTGVGVVLSVIEGIGRKVVLCADDDGEEACRVTARLQVDAPPDGVLRACTSHELLAGWLAPVEGELSRGGTFALEGGAHGTVLECAPEAGGHLFRITWLYNDLPGTSELTVRLVPAEDGRTFVTLDHLATHDPEIWDDFGPAASGVGWDLVLLGLALHVRGETLTDPENWQASPEAAAVKRASVIAWARALAESGAPEAHVVRAAENSLGFYLPAPGPPPEDARHVPHTAGE